MQKTATTKQDNSTQSVSSEKKPFVAPRLEKMDTTLTMSGTGSFSNTDFSTYSS
jgi:hypothetical protein